MRTTNKAMIPIVCLSLLLGACDSSDDASGEDPPAMGRNAKTTAVTNNDKTDIPDAAAIPSIQGKWATACLELGGLFRKQTLSITGSQLLTEFSAFSDQKCTVPVSIGVVVEGSTIQQSGVTVPTGNTRTTALGDAVEVDIHFKEATIDNKAIPTKNFLGREDFVERIEYDIALVNGDSLHLGDVDSYNGESAASRPITLNIDSIYSRVTE